MKGMAMDFVDYGYNFRLPELQAVMGCKQLKKMEQIIDKRIAILEEYKTSLEPMGFLAQSIAEGVRYNVQSLVFRVPEDCDRDALILGLRACSVESTIGTYALSSGTYYLNKYVSPQPNSEKLQATTITLPCFDGLVVGNVVGFIKSLLTRG